MPGCVINRHIPTHFGIFTKLQNRNHGNISQMSWNCLKEVKRTIRYIPQYEGYRKVSNHCMIWLSIEHKGHRWNSSNYIYVQVFNFQSDVRESYNGDFGPHLIVIRLNQTNLKDHLIGRSRIFMHRGCPTTHVLSGFQHWLAAQFSCTHAQNLRPNM